MRYPKYIRLIPLLTLPTLLLAVSLFQVDEKEAETQKAKNQPIAVIELFTSEGCSSCPPADQLLSTIINY